MEEFKLFVLILQRALNISKEPLTLLELLFTTSAALKKYANLTTDDIISQTNYCPNKFCDEN